ncbi:MAG TPA: ABC transporter permease [Cyclobacteriaceae bacterium]|nr:ABC transporter permease [Cyclobacteriaceae bacterium]
MLKNYLKVALRAIAKNKSYSIINVIGLAGSAAITMLIIFYAVSVLTYDQFHEDSDRIFFMYRDRATEDGAVPVYDTWFPMAEVAVDEFPVVESGTRMVSAGITWVRNGDKRFEQAITYADSALFKIFSFPLIEGDRNTLLNDPNSVVISEEVAKKFFGNEEALGKTLNFGLVNDRTVTGVIGKLPGNSTFTFEVIFPINTAIAHQFIGDDLWQGSFCNSFIKLRDVKDIDNLRSQANLIMEKYVESSERGNVLFLPLKDYNDEFTDQRKYAYTLLIVAFGILIIASINFTNLATAQSLMRTKEVGVRKVMGATRSGLINQFLSESVLLTLLALILGGFLAEISLPYFSQLIDLDIPINFLNQPSMIALILGLGLVVGIISGSYPSFYMSRFKPSEILKGSQTKGGSMLIRNGLVVVQFTLAITLLCAVSIISKQVNFMRSYDVKFDRDNVVVIPIGLRDFEDRENAVSRLVTFKEQLKTLPGVVSVTASNSIPGNYAGNFVLFLAEGNEDASPLDYRIASTEEDFFETYKIKFVAGRNFLPNSIHDRENSVILNEAAVRDIGWKDPIGKKLIYPRSRQQVEVIGVVEDFNYASLKQPVLPVVHYFGGDSARNYRFISIQLDAKSRDTALEQVGRTWESMQFDRTYEYFFPAERMDELYESEDNLINILTYATGFAIFIACLGLYALASFTVMLRTREIAIRRVLGASVGSIVGLFSKSYARMVLVAIFVSIPLAWFGMSEWLQGFAFRTNIGWTIFLFTGSIALIISFLTVSIHSIRAGYRDPVKSLRVD